MIGVTIGLTANYFYEQYSTNNKKHTQQAKKQAQRIATNLQLSAEQQEEVEEFVFDLLKQQNKIKEEITEKYKGKNTVADQQMKKSEMQEKMQLVTKQFDAGLKKILTEEQYQKRQDNIEKAQENIR